MAELHVSKKTISKFFSEIQNKKFIIPDYQRPYQWDVEKCEILWNDIEAFSENEQSNDIDYFLGTIVSYLNSNKNQEIIDGQQRITSLMLLLRAFYKKLEDMPEDKDVIGLKNQLSPCIWDIDLISQEVTDKTKIHIISEVATEQDTEILHHILETGEIDINKQDNYSKNYIFFKEKCDDYASKRPMQWKKLCITILHKCIILPIECDTQDTALTIFSTLNDRGMPLTDSDIFKAQIYRNYHTEEERKSFTDTWRELTDICKQAHISIDDVFRYYTHILRARNEDSSKEIGLRKFYAKDTYKILKEPKLMQEIMQLAIFWRYINTNIEPNDNSSYTISTQAKIYLHCLDYYTNDFWKYVISVFFIQHKEKPDFEFNFEAMLQKLVAFLFAKFIEKPSVSAIKVDIYNACVSFSKNTEHDYKITLNKDFLTQQISNYSSSAISKALLLLYAYLDPEQKELIEIFDVEHIFPKKWQDTNYNGWLIEDANKYLDNFGNKIIFERKLNIQAGNGYFGKKKESYSRSKITSVKKLAHYEKNDWTKEDIIKREQEFISTLILFFTENLQ